MAQQITLGCKAKDRITSLVGIITSRHEDFNGMVQWGLQPPVTKKAPTEHPAALSFDTVQLQYVGAGERAAVPKSDTVLSFKLGDRVRDRVSEYEGIAYSRNDFLNGCTTISIQGKGKEGELPPKSRHFAIQAIERIGDGINDKLAAKTAAPKEKTGGPPQRIERDSF